ncbi:hypothetical protein QYF36_026007 [Acer negundo]|nr:hypothetical protein QYF36_026007 [Acer negundo]
MELVHQNESIRRIEFTQLHTLTLECLPQVTSFSFDASTTDIGSQEIVAEDVSDGFMSLFSQNLRGLPKLAQFGSGNSIEFFSLTQISIKDCPKWKTFFSGSKYVNKEIEEMNCHDNIHHLFKEKVGFRDIKNFAVSNFPYSKEVRHEKILVSNLISLAVDDKCCSLRYIFTSSAALGLGQLQKLEIKNCAILEVIAVIEEETVTNNLFPNLHELKLINLPELSRFCNFVGNAIELPSLATLWIENCPNMETFISNFTGEDMSTTKDKGLTDIQPLFDEKNLITIQVMGCGSLKSIFPASVGRNLLRLEKLWIDNCCMVEEIFANEELVDEAVPQFPRLTLLRLGQLPRFRSFYPRVHISEWPMLKKLQVWICDEVGVSASNFLSFQVNHEMPLDQPLLLLDKLIFFHLKRAFCFLGSGTTVSSFEQSCDWCYSSFVVEKWYFGRDLSHNSNGFSDDRFS